MEGVTGVTESGTTTVDAESYATARESLTEDVNAAIRGLLKAGASEVVLTDGHGSGNEEPDYLMERLPASARHEIRDRPYDPYIDVVDGSYAAVVAVGMHAGSGEVGFLPHTVLSHTRWVARGFALKRSMIVAASAARYGVPVILVTGDDVLGEEVRAFSPSTRYVVVKKALSISRAESRQRADVSREIESVAEEAFRDRDHVAPWTSLLNGPLESEFGYRTGEQAALAALYPGVRVLNNRAITLESPSFLDAYLIYRALANYTFLAHMRWIVETMTTVKGGEDVLAELSKLYPPRSERTFAPSGADVPNSISATHGVE
jgi:D-amino peptidase